MSLFLEYPDLALLGVKSGRFRGYFSVSRLSLGHSRALARQSTHAPKNRIFASYMCNLCRGAETVLFGYFTVVHSLNKPVLMLMFGNCCASCRCFSVVSWRVAKIRELLLQVPRGLRQPYPGKGGLYKAADQGQGWASTWITAGLCRDGSRKRVPEANYIWESR